MNKNLLPYLGGFAACAALGSAAWAAPVGEAVLASATDPFDDRRDVVVLEEGPSPIAAAFVIGNQANPFGEPVLNPAGGLAVQVTANNFIPGTPGYLQQVEWLWGSATGDAGQSIDGPILGAGVSGNASLGFTNTGAVFLEVGDPGGSTDGDDPAELQLRDGSTAQTLLTVGDAFAGGSLSLIGAVRSDAAGRATLTARVDDGGAVGRRGCISSRPAAASRRSWRRATRSRVRAPPRWRGPNRRRAAGLRAPRSTTCTG